MAFGGSTLDRGIVSPIQDYIWTLREQIQKFVVRLGSHPNTVAWPYPWTSEDGLFFFWFGINNIWRSHAEIAGFSIQWDRDFRVDNGAGKIGSMCRRILTSYFAGIEEVLGAPNIVILNVPPMELSPDMRERTTAQQNPVRNAVVMWNSKLSGKVLEYRTRWKPAIFFYIDTHAIFHLVEVNAPSHGFLNKVTACPHYTPFEYAHLGYNNVTGSNIWESKYDPRCSGSVRRYMWLDAWHPTSKNHEIIAGQVAQALAEYPYL
ncbi:hypothetical protein BGX38DRAFT_1262819 [Terfezia claveryi]|nr:hypothetical protein BGX38DRAFT_1262819 [Terfezia claveryi]